MDIHRNIKDMLGNFIKSKNIPNIIFYGRSGSGKSSLLQQFICDIYENNKDNIKNNVFVTNCAKSNGIKFIRDEIKMFVKTNTPSNSMGFSKTVVLDHADELTDDAQSVLRRCIEIYNNTRFFIVIEDYSRLINPIISRFCSIYVSLPLIKGEYVNLHTYKIGHMNAITKPHYSKYKTLTKLINTCNPDDISILDLSYKLYNMCYESNDIIRYIIDTNEHNSELFKCIFKLKKDTNNIPNERYIIWYILNYSFTFLKTI